MKIAIFYDLIVVLCHIIVNISLTFLLVRLGVDLYSAAYVMMYLCFAIMLFVKYKQIHVFLVLFWNLTHCKSYVTCKTFKVLVMF